MSQQWASRLPLYCHMRSKTSRKSRKYQAAEKPVEPVTTALVRTVPLSLLKARSLQKPEPDESTSSAWRQTIERGIRICVSSRYKLTWFLTRKVKAARRDKADHNTCGALYDNEDFPMAHYPLLPPISQLPRDILRLFRDLDITRLPSALQ